MFDNYDDILTVAEVMALLYVGKNTVYRLLQEGELRGFRIGKTWRIPKISLEEYIISKNQ
jgi:excisionase family DNA binding protein